jgi:predicted short-subunit dehydrogenase-like oxidoreductase (DUF2520 family)
LAFARSWTAAGGRIAGIVARDPSRVSIADLGDVPLLSEGEARLPGCDILILAVSDDAIAAAATKWAGRLACRYAFHFSGALGSDELASLRRGGSSVGSLHPVRPFTGGRNEDWRGVLVAVEGDTAAADVGEAIARAVGARPYRLAAEAKPLYHAAASLAAGGAAAIVSVAVRAWVAAGIPEEIARETLAGLASRATAAVGEHPFAEAFTGAVARRDVGTVRTHARALAGHEEALNLYRALGEEILRRTSGRGKEKEIREILRAGRAPF